MSLLQVKKSSKRHCDEEKEASGLHRMLRQEYFQMALKSIKLRQHMVFGNLMLMEIGFMSRQKRQFPASLSIHQSHLLDIGSRITRIIGNLFRVQLLKVL